MPGELQRVPEDGFRHPHEYAALTGDGAVCLSNSVSLSDLPRLKMRLEQQKAAGISLRAGAKQWATGQVLVTKVFLGKSAQEMNVVQVRLAPKIGEVGQRVGWRENTRIVRLYGVLYDCTAYCTIVRRFVRLYDVLYVFVVLHEIVTYYA
eukprot:9215319-Pyramimonas_sp.AAC.1